MDLLGNIFRKAWKKSLEKSRTCDLCGREVFSYPTPRLCNGCLGKLIQNKAPYCDKCGRATKTEGVCFQCKGNPPAFTKACSPIVYFGDGALLINAFKNGKRYLSFYLAEEIVKVMHRLQIEDEAPILLPVPLTKAKRKERGYNQAEELARVLAELTGYPMQTGLVEKLKQKAQQKHLSAKERRDEIVGSFFVTDRKACKDKTFLVVDDILTTGATGGELARILKGAGAKAVYVCTATALPERT